MTRQDKLLILKLFEAELKRLGLQDYCVPLHIVDTMIRSGINAVKISEFYSLPTINPRQG